MRLAGTFKCRIIILINTVILLILDIFCSYVDKYFHVRKSFRLFLDRLVSQGNKRLNTFGFKLHKRLIILSDKRRCANANENFIKMLLKLLDIYIDFFSLANYRELSSIQTYCLFTFLYQSDLFMKCLQIKIIQWISVNCIWVHHVQSSV